MAKQSIVLGQDKISQIENIDANFDELYGQVAGKQAAITSTNKLSSDLVDDTNKTNKFVGVNDVDVSYKTTPVTKLLSYSGDTVTITQRFTNLKTGTTSTKTEAVELANGTTAGLMSPDDVTAIQQMRTELDQLEGQSIRLVYTTKDNPTASEIGTFVTESGYTQSQFPTIGVVVKSTNHIWRWYNNTNAWQDIGVDTVNQFTNTVAGVIKGSQTNGKVYAESDGTGSVYGWAELQNTVQGLGSDVSDLEAGLMDLDDAKQDKLISGTNIKSVNGHTLLGSGNIQTTFGDIGGTVIENQELSEMFDTKQNAITSSSKLSASLIATSTSLQFVSSSEKATWDNHGQSIQSLESDLNALELEVEEKQNALSTQQLNAVNSGITSSKVSTYDGYAQSIDSLDSDVTALDADKQDKLVSGTNIKTINNTSILGSGNITVAVPIVLTDFDVEE